MLLYSYPSSTRTPTPQIHLLCTYAPAPLHSLLRVVLDIPSVFKTRTTHLSAIEPRNWKKKRNPFTYRNIQIRYLPLILLPILPILLRTPMIIPISPMQDHRNKENRQKPRQRALKSTHQAPTRQLNKVRGIMHLARLAIPPTRHQRPTILTTNESRVLDSLIRKLRERLTRDESSLLHLPEPVLLRIAGIENEVSSGQEHEESDVGEGGPLVDAGIVTGEVKDSLAVGEGNAGHVPEDQHEAPLLGGHVVGGDDEFLALGAGINVEPEGVDVECGLRGHETVFLELFKAAGDGEDPENVPRKADFEEHFKIDNLENAGVELGAHEEIVRNVAGHLMLRSTGNGRNVGDYGDKNAREDTGGHVSAEIIDELDEVEETGKLENNNGGQGSIKRPHGVAVIIETLAIEMREGVALGPNSRKSAVKKNLIREETPIDRKGTNRRHGTL